jgi:hypothetical protein
MPSPLVVVDIARSLPSWNAAGERVELEAFVRNVRASLAVLVAGERGATVARSAFERRKADPQDPEKRPDFDGLSGQERAALAQLAGSVQSEAVRRGIVTAAGAGGGVRGAGRGD